MEQGGQAQSRKALFEINAGFDERQLGPEGKMPGRI
jgi:hypothetical protein